TRCAEEAAHRVPDVLPAAVDPDRNPDGAGRLDRQGDVAERAPGGSGRGVGRHAAREVRLGLARQVITNVLIPIPETTAPTPRHAGRSTRAIARAIRSHFEVSTTSCFRPAAVSR